MKRALVLTAAALLIVAVGAQAATQLQTNKLTARRDARQLLRRLRMPKHLSRIGSAPRWAIQAAGLPLAGEISAADVSAADETWWTTTASPQAIIDFVKAHPPAGAADDGTGTEQNSQTGVNSLNVEFSWPPGGVQLYDRTLTVTVVAPPHGDSVVVAQSQSAWIVPRPASELVPGGTRVVDARLRIGHGLGGSRHMRTSTYVVRRPARVTAIVRQFNALQTVQAGSVMAGSVMAGSVMAGCTLMLPDRPYLTLTFRAGRGPGHPVLAHAEVFVSPGSKGASGRNSCDPIVFWIGRREEPMLTSPTFVRWIGRLTGANIS
jgi:hypothetical protein